MKKQLITIFIVAVNAITNSTIINAQTVSTYENLALNSNSYWNGSSQPMGACFESGNANFPNYYNPTYGGYWELGWAYSNMNDSITSGFTNLYSARTAKGYDNSSNYAVGQQNAVIKLTGNALGKVIDGMYVTNGTYAYLSMLNGDAYAKKFGGVSGNDPDWFKLTIRKWYNGILANDSVTFYLADYRFANNTEDYIVKNWNWIDLKSLGNVDSLKFVLSSSDNGAYGMNTPAFYCIDNFTTTDSPLLLANSTINYNSFNIYPNPAKDLIHIDISQLKQDDLQVRIIDLSGKELFTKSIDNNEVINISDFQKGLYFVQIFGNNVCLSNKFVKE